MKDCDSHNSTSVVASTNDHLSYDDTENCTHLDVNG